MTEITDSNKIAKPRFGITFSSSLRNHENIPKLAVAAEENGVDFVAFQDQIYNPYWLDSFLLMAQVGFLTKRVGIQLCVATMTLRPPAVFAKSIMSLDHLTNGRVELGIGSGGPQYREGVVSLRPQSDFITGGKAVDLIIETVGIMRTIWQPGPELPPLPEDPLERMQALLNEVPLPVEPGQWPRVSYKGKQLTVDNAFAGPAPAHDIPLLIGATKPRMTKLAGSIGDGWIVSYGRHTKEELLALHDKIDEGAREAGRDPAEIVRQYNMFGAIGDKPVRYGDRTSPCGSVDFWIDELTRCFTDLRSTQINFWLGDDPEQSEIYVKEIVPGVRKNLGIT